MTDLPISSNRKLDVGRARFQPFGSPTWRKAQDLPGVLARRRFRALRLRFYRELWRDAAADAGAELTDLGTGILAFRRGGRLLTASGEALGLDPALLSRLFGNKPRTLALLAERGLPVPEYVLCSAGEREPAHRLLARAPAGLAVKPAADTGAGHGVTCGVRTPRDLDRAVRHAASFHADVMVEPMQPGASFRLLFLDGQFIEAVRRDPPVVLGDGQTTIRTLMRRETARRLAASRPEALNPLLPDQDAALCLAAAGLTLAARPDAGRLVVVKSAVNQNAAAENHRVAEVHPGIVARLGAAMCDLGVRLAGVDVMASRLDAPLEETGGVVGEINVAPGLHHHVLVASGPARPTVAARILDRLLGATGDRP